MKRIMLRQADSRGFTLLELVVTLTIAAILASMLLAFMGTGITGSVDPITMLREQNRNNEVMEKIVGDYKSQIKNSTLDLSAFSGHVTETYGSRVDGIATAFVSYDDTDGDGVYEESLCTYGDGCKNLKITLTTGVQSITALFTE